LHLGFLLFVPFCVWATWWQITRAEDGNGLSYLYSFEWPVFALLGLYFWWMFLHTDYNKVGLKGMQNQREAAGADAADAASAMTPPVEATAPEVRVPSSEESPELAAYNARLAALATRGAKTWRTPEEHVARRSP
jgi:hypothetical protein